MNTYDLRTNFYEQKVINQVTQEKYQIPEFSCSLHNKQIGTIHNC